MPSYLAGSLIGLVFAAGVSVAQPSSVDQVNVPPSVSDAATTGAGSDRYEFAATDSVAHAVRLIRTAEGARFSWPRATASWDTALVAVRCRSGDMGSWVELSVGELRVQQYLDANAVGVRWLNLSGLRARLVEGAEVHIRSHAVTLAAESATLRLFDNHLDLQQRMLVVAPHPDDAEIAAFGLYADRNATIVTVTAGNAGDMNYRASVSDPAEHYALKGYLRAIDSVTVPWQGQIPPARTANLGYFDGRLDAMYLAPRATLAEVYGPNTDVARYRRVNLSRLVSSVPRSNTWDHLVEDLVEVLRKVNPKIVVMPDPRLDTHPDHEFTSVALDQALQQWHGDPVFLLYTNHTDSNHYPYGPAGTVVSLPPSEAHVSVRGIYSHPTSPALQIRKLFALESMHDLRLSPEEQMTCNAPSTVRRPDNPRIPEEDYFRRAPRANELFFEFNRSGVHAAIQEFLADYQVQQAARTAHPEK